MDSPAPMSLSRQDTAILRWLRASHFWLEWFLGFPFFGKMRVKLSAGSGGQQMWPGPSPLISESALLHATYWTRAFGRSRQYLG